MAGKENTAEASEPASLTPPFLSSLESGRMEANEKEVCWRREVDTKLKRLHSLLFGADLALQKEDFSSALVLGLRLVGFLDSNSNTDVDEAFIRPIRRDALSKIDTARRSLVPESDRYSLSLSEYVCIYVCRLVHTTHIMLGLINEPNRPSLSSCSLVKSSFQTGTYKPSLNKELPGLFVL